MADITARESELISTLLQTWSDKGKVMDNIFAKNAIVRYLGLMDEKDGDAKYGGKRLKLIDPGLHIEHTIEYGKAGNFKSFSGLEQFNMTPNEIVTNAQFAIKNIGGFVTLIGEELAKRSGANAIVGYAKTQLDSAIRSARELINEQLLATTAAAATKDFEGFASFIHKDPTASAVVGGINQSTAANAWWRNQIKDMDAHTTLKQFMASLRTLANNCSDNAQNERPDLMITTQQVHEYFEQYMEDKGYVTWDKQMQGIGFELLKVYGATVIWDGNMPEMGVKSGESSLFLVNTEHFCFNIFRNSNFKVGKQVDLQATGQDGIGYPIIARGNISYGSRRLHGLGYDIAINLS